MKMYYYEEDVINVYVSKLILYGCLKIDSE